MLFQETGGRKGFNGKKDHFVAKNAMVAVVLMGFLAGWPSKNGLRHQKFKNTSLPTGKP
ncbi:hypothetical protein ACF8OI_01135 [Aeromonas bivalvium]|uniref:hypothetical protein n=1 Tax=Aeromonas bivalvium TaxID=440079 RepID=UPI00370A0891